MNLRISNNVKIHLDSSIAIILSKHAMSLDVSLTDGSKLDHVIDNLIRESQGMVVNAFQSSSENNYFLNYIKFTYFLTYPVYIQKEGDG